MLHHRRRWSQTLPSTAFVFIALFLQIHPDFHQDMLFSINRFLVVRVLHIWKAARKSRYQKNPVTGQQE